ncbi:thioesterase family protein [Actinomadura meridiana]|uniref:Thioesterase family protein n=1 Tax=Actinomadura meridiana TaxID=559626 RepID=A0ABP8BSE6_9ACTN
MTVEPGVRATTSILVGDADTASSVGSGDVPVLATPRLLAVAEAATVEAVRKHLGEGRTSVGTRVELKHLAPSPVGARVTIEAELREVDGPRLVFAFSAVDDGGTIVGSGVVHRTIVDRARFLARLTASGQ